VRAHLVWGDSSGEVPFWAGVFFWVGGGEGAGAIQAG
jgi:hypothetical protein